MRILLVDDDPGVIQSLLALLKEIPQADIRAATNPELALEHATALGGLDLLITDVVMQPIDGFALRDAVLSRFPSAKIIFITGYDLSDYTEQTAGFPVLPKPIDRQSLLDAIQKTLTTTPAPRPIAQPPNRAARPPTNPPRPSTLPPSTPRPAPIRPSIPRPSTPPRQPSAETNPTAIPPTVPLQQPVPPSSHTPSPDLSGQTLGTYQIQAKLGDGRWGSVYQAVQTSINRIVALKVLESTQADDSTSQTRFIADARAKAHVQHPSTLAVYEAGEASGKIFYAHEFVDGQTMAQLQAANSKLDEPSALHVLRTATEGLAYLADHKIPHSPLEAGHLYLNKEGHARLANLAEHSASETLTTEAEIQVLGRILLGVLRPLPKLSPSMQDLIKRMIIKNPQSFTAWAQVSHAIKNLEPKIIPLEAARITAQDRAAVAAVARLRQDQKRSLTINIIVFAALFLAAIGVTYIGYRKFFTSNSRKLSTQILIPAGEFPFGPNAEIIHLPDFWIDQYEVTFAQYAQFVQYLEDHPAELEKYDDPRQPRIKSQQKHKPLDWDVYYPLALSGKPAHGVPLDLNCPVMQVDWWDAAAYAKWKGRELPTEQEWEKASRGPTGLIYPWGDEPDLKKANSNADYNPSNPAIIGKIDGFNFWNPVDKIKSDKSPYGVFGMAGNVGEWTATWDKEKKQPITKGGSFISADLRLDSRKILDPNVKNEAYGFRTVTHQKPAKP